MLLTITETIALCYDAHDQESFLTFKQGGSNREGRTHRLVGIGRERLFLLIDHRLVGRKKELETHHTLTGNVRCVADTRGNDCMVAQTKEARKVGLYHHILLCHHVGLYQSVAHFLVVSKSHEAPRCYALRQTELQTHLSERVGAELRIKESCLLQVFT